MEKNFCPTCGGEQVHDSAEICPHCGVRVRDPPMPRWAYLSIAGFATGFVALILIVFLLGVWQGTLIAEPVPVPTPQTTTLPTIVPNTTVTTVTRPPSAGVRPENDFISDLAGDINVSRVEGSLAEGGSDLFSFSLGEHVHLSSLTLEGPDGTDFDLYLKKGGTPTLTSFDWRSVGDGSFERVEIWGALPGTYTVMVHARSGEGPYVLARTTSYNEASAISLTPTVPQYYWSSPFAQPADWVV